MANILVVEDNLDLAELMAIHLRRAGYTPLLADSAAAALAALERGPVHLIIADVMLPGADGFSLVRELREAGDETPVLMATARETLDDKRQGFHAGADDYMVKPIDFEEMLLRVEALLRRDRIKHANVLHVRESILNGDSLCVTFRTAEGMRQFCLPQKEFFVLFLLLSNPGRIFTRQTLMDEVWGYDSESDPRTVDVHIKRLREKFAAALDFEIVTVRGLGYKAVIR